MPPVATITLDEPYAFVFSDYSIHANFQHLSFISNTILEIKLFIIMKPM